jgi:ABC-type branched-subunit amino acid transport system ATPase component
LQPRAAGDRKLPELEEIFTLFPKLKERRSSWRHHFQAASSKYSPLAVH